MVHCCFHPNQHAFTFILQARYGVTKPTVQITQLTDMNKYSNTVPIKRHDL
ncbi:hypothetical protein [Vibrio gallaecicus]|uniref:hypothetical protein n=1 Tax=Vibrio gallaecicus TaxID=552386 RepID=UPI0025B47698|nr:hypothetical protein [Vibrio gallaecicus]MDN3616586.1 hypothetical protein [Vibrio gallaecicus]